MDPNACLTRLNTALENGEPAEAAAAAADLLAWLLAGGARPDTLSPTAVQVLSLKLSAWVDEIENLKDSAD